MVKFALLWPKNVPENIKTKSKKDGLRLCIFLSVQVIIFLGACFCMRSQCKTCQPLLFLYCWLKKNLIPWFIGILCLTNSNIGIPMFEFVKHSIPINQGIKFFFSQQYKNNNGWHVLHCERIQKQAPKNIITCTERKIHNRSPSFFDFVFMFSGTFLGHNRANFTILVRRQEGVRYMNKIGQL